MSGSTLAARARDWTLWLTRQESVNGGDGERRLAETFRARLAETPAFASAETWLVPCEGDVLKRSCLALLLSGEGDETLVLTGHFDTVSIENYGDLAPLATQPEQLALALRARVDRHATPAEERTRADLDSGDYIPGRGLLDMKAGLAAALAVMEEWAARPVRRGNLLFVAVPDEEVNSVGARQMAVSLPLIAQEKTLRLCGIVNLDAIADDGTGEEGRAIALGSVGKLLVTAFVVGQESHACYPFAGLNGAALAGALAAEVEWADDLGDDAAGVTGMPPTLLSLKDSKTHYDVTTPASAFAIWNVLTLQRSAHDVMARFRAHVETAGAAFRDRLMQRRRIRSGDASPLADIAILTADDLLAGLDAEARARIAAAAADWAQQGLDLPEQCRRITDMAWRGSGRRGPAIVLGFGSIPYPAVLLDDGADAQRLKAAVDQARDKAHAQHGVGIKTIPFFPGISDMSFFGEADVSALRFVMQNTPAWDSGVRWKGGVANVPTINAGPWGRDYHTPYERMHVGYGFTILPEVLRDIADAMLGGAA